MTLTSISLETTNPITNCDNGYIEIRCVINGELVAEIIEIELKRRDVYIVSVSRDVAFEGNVLDYVSTLEDTEIANRSGVVVSSLIRDVGVSYLSIRIMGSMLKPQKDKGPYQCELLGFDSNYGFIREDSRMEMLNITGNTKQFILIRPGL